jgi:alanyl-tRNA synthetase
LPGRFQILREEGIATGVRRIKAVLATPDCVVVQRPPP